MNRWMKGIVTAIAIGLLAVVARADIEVEIETGHNGRWISRAPTPLTVVLANDGSDPVEVLVSVKGRGMLSQGSAHERKVFVGAGATRRELLVLDGVSGFGQLEVTIRTSPRAVLHHRGTRADKGFLQIDLNDLSSVGDRALAQHDRVVGAVFDRSRSIASYLPRSREAEASAMGADVGLVGVVDVDAATLAGAPYALGGIDTLVVCDPDESFLVEPDHLERVLDWVALGGRLVVGLGKNAAGFGTSPLARHLPARWTSATDRAIEPLLPFVRLTEDRLPPLRGAVCEITPAGDGVRVVKSADDEILIARRRFGQGSLAVWCTDPSRLARLLSQAHPKEMAALGRMLAPRLTPEDRKIPDAGAIMDMQSQVKVETSLTRVLQQDAFEPPNLVLVLIGLIAYVLVVGPLDWLILKRAKKERFTTITFTAAVTAFTLVAYGASFLLFSSGEVVNRVVLVDLADGGRDGRQLMSVMDIASYYAPIGERLEIDYEADSFVASGALPGFSSGDTGTVQRLVTLSRTPTRGISEVPISIRSQRAVRGLSVRPTGRTIDATWVKQPDGSRKIEITNGLTIDLTDVFVLTPLIPNNGGRPRRIDQIYALGAIDAGDTASAGPSRSVAAPGGMFNRSRREIDADPSREEVLGLFGFLSYARFLSEGFADRPFQRLDEGAMARLLKAGVDRSETLLSGESALLIAYAEESPVDLPAEGRDGRTYVILRKEIPLR